MAQEKDTELRNFLNGVNSDVDGRMMPEGSYMQSLNMEIVNQAGKPIGVIRNVKGNTLVSYTLPTGINEVIYSKADPRTRRVFYFVHNSGGKHSILEYNGRTDNIEKVLESITDTSDVDVLQFDKLNPVRKAAIYDSGQLIWTEGNKEIKSINIDQAKAGGYETSDHTAFYLYKSPPRVGPQLSFISDGALEYNYIHKHQFKASYRYVYGNNQKSTWSDLSDVSFLPDDQEVSNVFVNLTTNNVLGVSVNTGSFLVEQLEIAIQVDGGPFMLAKRIIKSEEGLTDNTVHVYQFHNNAIYATIDPEQFIKPHDFLPKRAQTLDIAQESYLILGQTTEDFGPVDMDASTDVEMVAYDITGPANPNAPAIDVVYIDNSGFDRMIEVQFGASVMAGNIFHFTDNNTYPPDFEINYVANAADTMESVRQKFFNYFVATYVDWGPYNYTITLYNANAIRLRAQWSGVANPSPWDGITSFAEAGTEPGTCIQALKGGAQYKLFIEYEDEVGRKSLAYTTDSMDFNTEVGVGHSEKPLATLSVNHAPPIWAWKWQPMLQRLNPENFVQFVSNFASTNNLTNNYEIQFGGISVYQFQYPNTNVKFNFQKGDRVRFIGYIDGSDVLQNYTAPLEETVIIDVLDQTYEVINARIKTNGSATVDVDRAEPSDAGKVVNIGGILRRILSVGGAGTLAATYVLEQPVYSSANYESFSLLQDTPRIVIPALPAITTSNRYFLEVYSQRKVVENTFCYSIGQKYEVFNPGTDERAHQGSLQNQEVGVQPALITIEKADTYIRERQIPTETEFDFGIVTVGVESFHSSDFYDSNENDFGRPNTEYDGGDEKFYERLRFSNPAIKNTNINGLNTFDNLDRKDIGDKYGRIALVHFNGDNLYFFKDSKVGYVGVNKVYFSQKNSDAEIVGASGEVLSDPEYYQFEGGIGDFIYSHIQGMDSQFFICPQTKTFCQLTNQGIEEISKIYFEGGKFTEHIARTLTAQNFKIIAGYEMGRNQAHITFVNGQVLVSNDDFSEAGWKTAGTGPTDPATIIITTAPTLGDVTVDGSGIATYESTGGTGTDFFEFTIEDGDSNVYDEKKICILVSERPTGWVGLDPACVLDESLENTGFVHYANKQLVYTDETGGPVVPETIENNDDYVVPDYYDDVMCELPGDEETYYISLYFSIGSLGETVTFYIDVYRPGGVSYGTTIHTEVYFEYVAVVSGDTLSQTRFINILPSQYHVEQTYSLSGNYDYGGMACFASVDPVTNGPKVLIVNNSCVIP